MPYRKFNLTVGELAPFLDGRSESAPGRLIDDFSGFAASCFKGQRESLLVLLARHLVCQITRANEHVGTPNWGQQGGHEHPTVELEHGQSSRGFCPRCPLSDRSTNGAIGIWFIKARAVWRRQAAPDCVLQCRCPSVAPHPAR